MNQLYRKDKINFGNYDCGDVFRKDEVMGEQFALKQATLSDLKAALAEHGWMASPIEPTEAMIDAGYSENQESCGYQMSGATFAEIYKAMIAAAQKEGET
jgi:hypothetical protein